MSVDFYKREVISTEDGSTSLKLRDADEQYHSLHGALNESLYIYINSGLHYLAKNREIRIFEAGFGTGLNAILTYMDSSFTCPVIYDSVELYPLECEEIKKLNFNEIIKGFPSDVFEMMHHAESGIPSRISPNFVFTRFLQPLEVLKLPFSHYDLVYFDMFNPDLQPELWTEEIFTKLFSAMKTGGVLVTYCAKGRVKRALKSVGFQVESLPGPVRKREITRALK